MHRGAGVIWQDWVAATNVVLNGTLPNRRPYRISRSCTQHAPMFRYQDSTNLELVIARVNARFCLDTDTDRVTGRWNSTIRCISLSTDYDGLYLSETDSAMKLSVKGLVPDNVTMGIGWQNDVCRHDMQEKCRAQYGRILHMGDDYHHARFSERDTN